MADTFVFTGLLIIYPIHFGTYKLHGRESAAQVGFTPFPFHGKGKIFGTAGNPIFIERAVGFRKRDSSVKRNICFFNGSILKQVFINFDGIESSISKENFRINKRMFLEEIL